MTLRKFFLCLVVILLFAWVLTLFSADAPIGSTYSTRPKGAGAVYQTLEQLDFPVSRFRHAFSELAKHTAGEALVVIAPSQMPAAKGLKDWVAKGNTLLYFANRGVKEDPIFDEFGVQVVEEKEIGPEKIIRRTFVQTAEFRCPKSRTTTCATVSEMSDTTLFPFASKNVGVPLRFSDGLVTGVMLEVAQGTAWLFTDSAPILNESIDLYDNIDFVHAVLKGYDSVLFDEFHHGFVAPAEGVTSIHVWLLVAFSAFALFVLVIAVISRAVRFGPPLAQPEIPLTASTEFVRALGMLYSEKKIRGVLNFYVDAWRKRAAASIGGAVHRSAEQIVDIFAEKGILSPGAAKDARLALITLSSEGDIDSTEMRRAVSILESSICERASNGSSSQDFGEE